MTDDKKEILRKAQAVLSKNPIFSGLDDFYLEHLMEKGEVRSYARGTQLITEGEQGMEVFFILSGKARVTLYGEEGREIVLAVLKDGDMFGEMSIVDEKPRSASVEAIGALECLVINKAGFLEYLSRHHRVYIRMFAYITARLRDATRKIGGLALLDVCGRIAHTLIGLAKPGAKDKSVTIERPTHEEIAAMIGSSREVVSRALKKMSAEGFIKIEKDKLVLFIHPE